ncbi:MAG: cytochrome c [Planctomycetota bacterium]
MKLPDLDIDLRLFTAPPMWLIAVMVTGAFVPMTLGAAIWYKRNSFSEKPRIHLLQDMDNQAKYKAQSTTEVFEHGLAMRQYAPGTVAWGRTVHQPDPGMLMDSDLAYRGFAVDPATGETVVEDDGQGNLVPKYLDGFPEVVTVNTAFLELGQRQYNNYCATCHGYDGLGNGATHRAASTLAEQPGNPSNTNWVAPKNLIDATYTRAGGYEDGEMFNTISMGKNNMAGYSAQISVEDRWAIVAYVRAMQKTGEAPEPARAKEPGAEQARTD